MAASENIPSLMIPMWGEPLLLPNTSVAEVIGFVMPQNGDGGDFLGQIKWRGQDVPVLNLEADAPPIDSIGRAARIAVFNSASGKTKQPFVAVLVNGIPRLNNIRPDNLRYATDDADENLPNGIQARVMLGQEVMRLVDLAVLEQLAEKAVAA